jgi:Zn finger protein HypA/HybF involved in hydrogenase expression
MTNHAQPFRVTCNSCGCVTLSSLPLLVCPSCGSERVTRNDALAFWIAAEMAEKFGIQTANELEVK